jgi:hypothetical protein
MGPAEECNDLVSINDSGDQECAGGRRDENDIHRLADGMPWMEELVSSRHDAFKRQRFVQLLIDICIGPGSLEQWPPRCRSKQLPTKLSADNVAKSYDVCGGNRLIN